VKNLKYFQKAAEFSCLFVTRENTRGNEMLWEGMNARFEFISPTFRRIVVPLSSRMKWFLHESRENTRGNKMLWEGMNARFEFITPTFRRIVMPLSSRIKTFGARLFETSVSRC
jgi:hypothetical protein